VKVLSALFHQLLPQTKENAQEIIELLNRIADLRQLSPHEIRVLGQAYLLGESVDDAERVFRSGRKRYPPDSRFVFEHAHTLFLRGDDEGAYEAMREYAQLAERDDATYSNIGTLAESTGRLGEAITMFQAAIPREKDPTQLGRLHCALFHLRRHRGDIPKEVLRHAILFGKTIGGDAEKEALFLTMCLMTPLSEEDMKDPEVCSWKGEIQSRLAAFSQEHPNFEGLRSFQIPQELPPEEQGAYLLSTLAALPLPSQLRSERAELAARGAAWPLATRAAFMIGMRSVFEYWQKCTASQEFSHSIHIWEPSLDFAEEVKRIDFSRPVCIDLTALLTLNALDLIEEVTDLFPEFVLSRGTLRAIQKERYSLFFSHPLAIRLDGWITAHRRKIRTLPVLGVSDFGSLDEARYRWEDGLWVPRRRTVAELVGDGVGESLLLAAQKNFLFFCDDLTVRQWARDEFHIGAFSTLALLARLREEQRLSIAHEARYLAKLISLHYRVVPFGVLHLDCEEKRKPLPWSLSLMNLAKRTGGGLRRSLRKNYRTEYQKELGEDKESRPAKNHIIVGEFRTKEQLYLDHT
jgi:tetratricopeptide (TPR) repeat protein